MADQRRRGPARSASAIAYEAATALYDDVFDLHLSLAGKAARMQHVLDHISQSRAARCRSSRTRAGVGHEPRAFSRVFAPEGMPPAEFVLHRRLLQAAAPLAKNTVPVKGLDPGAAFRIPTTLAKVFRHVHARA